jgi:uncharacterized protein (TIGR03435 family)
MRDIVVGVLAVAAVAAYDVPVGGQKGDARPTFEAAPSKPNPGAMAILVGVVAAASHAAAAQIPATFEVASVKVSHATPPFRVGVEFLPGGQVRAENAPLPMLLQAAFDSHQVDETEAKSDVWQSLYNIDARAGAAALPATAPTRERDAQLSAMLLALLVDRFKLAYHVERREVPVYALTVAPGGPKLTRSPAARTCAREEQQCGRLPGGPASGLSGINVSVTRLADDLTLWLEREVVDRTGLTGVYDITLPPWSRALRSASPAGTERADDPSNPALSTVVRERLGLQINAVREPRDVYVIDRVSLPSEN